jgi:exonuclease III
LEGGCVDVFRERHPDSQEFTCHAHRFGRKGSGRGWRWITLSWFVIVSAMWQNHRSRVPGLQ